MSEQQPTLQHFVIDEEAAGKRIDQYLGQAVDNMSRARVQVLIKAGHVTKNGQPFSENKYKLRCDDVLTISIPVPEDPTPLGEDIPLTIVYEDDDIIIINKPTGLVVHPGPGNWTGTLVNALIHHCGDSLSGIGGIRRPGIVHRLDKDTTGLLVVAKNDRAHRHLSKQFADHGRTNDLERRYHAFVWGVPMRTKDTINEPIGRKQHNRLQMTVLHNQYGKEAITHFSLLEKFTGLDGKGVCDIAMVECRLETGRTHQIRVHMRYIGHPVIGDQLYASHFQTKLNKLEPDISDGIRALNRQALHAAVLQITHPITKEVMRFESDLPDDLQHILTMLRDVQTTA